MPSEAENSVITYTLNVLDERIAKARAEVERDAANLRPPSRLNEGELRGFAASVHELHSLVARRDELRELIKQLTSATR